jgi:hypothetical protein
MMKAIGFSMIAAVMISAIASVAAQSNYPERNIRDLWFSARRRLDSPNLCRQAVHNLR